MVDKGVVAVLLASGLGTAPDRAWLQEQEVKVSFHLYHVCLLDRRQLLHGVLDDDRCRLVTNPIVQLFLGG